MAGNGDKAMTPPYEISGIVLAGGDSRRMGMPKADLDLGGRTLITRVLDQLEPLCAEVMIVGRSMTDMIESDHKLVRDLVPGLGPLGGLVTGLFYARYAWTLVAACDLPFLDRGVLELIITEALRAPAGPRAVVPKTECGWQPLIAAYSKTCLGPARKALNAGLRKVDALKNHGIIWHSLTTDHPRDSDNALNPFINLNTPAELAQARRRITDQE